MARVAPPTATHPYLRGDANGHYRILVLGRTSSDKRRTVKRLSRALTLEVFSLEAEAQKSTQTPSGFEYGASWLIHGTTIVGECAKRALDDATHIIWLDAPFSSIACRFRQHFLAEMIQFPSKLGIPSPLGVLAADWEEHWHERGIIDAIYQADDRQGRWQHFTGWRGRIELRAWLKRDDPATRDETRASLPFYPAPDDHYYQPWLMIF